MLIVSVQLEIKIPRVKLIYDFVLIFSAQLEIKIPRVKLSFASKSGLKRIPKKRPADRDASECSTSTVYHL